MDWALIWIVAGIVMIVIEFFVSTFVIIFFGIAALATGIALWAGLSPDHGIPLLLFAALSVGLLLLLRSRFKDWFVGKTVSADADDDFLGHEATIESGFDASEPRRGKVNYRGAAWDARSNAGPIGKGAFVRITRRHGVILEIEPISKE